MNDELILRAGERLDDLCFGDMKLIQRADAFRFGTDSVLLADFVNPHRGERIADLGAGTGAIATLMAAHQEGVQVEAIEIQTEIADMLSRSVEYNRLTERIRVHNMDMREAAKRIGYGTMSACVCNPPYGKAGGTLLSVSETKRIARHECDITPEEICRSAAELLKYGGRFAVVYPAPRGFEMMRAMYGCGLAPKRIRTVHSYAGRAPKLLLMDAVKGGGDMLHWLEPLVLYEADGTPTAEWKRIYRVDTGITSVTRETLEAAAHIHSESWRESHKAFCSAEFIAKHDTAHQKAYLQGEMDAGKALYMLTDKCPVGIVGVSENRIENLYVLPEYQNRGYGTKLLKYAMAQCTAAPTLWVLDNNLRALRWYMKIGFVKTGAVHRLTPTLTEIELRKGT